MFVGRTLTHNELILALKYAFQLGDSNDAHLQKRFLLFHRGRSAKQRSLFI